MSTELITNWTDVPLIADDTTSAYLSQHDNSDHAVYYATLVLSDDHLAMWNIATNEIRLADKLRDIREIRQPFWVDERSIAHLLPETALSTASSPQRKYFTDNLICNPPPPPAHTMYALTNCHTDTPSADVPPSSLCASRRWIKVISAYDMTAMLRAFPTMPLLLIDQYQQFIVSPPDGAKNVTFLFTGAPVRGLLSDADEQRFWQRIALQSHGQQDRLAYPLESRQVIVPSAADKGRRCAEIWHYFVPSSDYLMQNNTLPDIRLLDIHLMDANDTFVWRHLLSTVITNEQHQHESPAPPAQNVVLLIRLRYEAKEAQDRAEEKRAALQKSRPSGQAWQRQACALTLSAVKLRFKRFAAFFMRVKQQSQEMPHAPPLFWTMRDDEQPIIRLIYHEIFRETLKGRCHHLIAYDRFLTITPPASRLPPPYHLPPYHNQLIRAYCSMREPTDTQKNADNVLGIMDNMLINHHAFSSDVYLLAQSGVYIKKHKSTAPIYKLRMSEI